eukprot:12826856-Ditylum_brightwellii.AAC.1
MPQQWRNIQKVNSTARSKQRDDFDAVHQRRLLLMSSKMNEDITGEYQHLVIILKEQQYQYVKNNYIAVSGFKRTKTDTI